MATNRGFPAAFVFCFHTVVFAINLYGVFTTWDLPLQSRNTYGGQWKFMTFWDQIVQTVYFGLCVLNDILGSNLKSWDDQEQRSALQRLRDTLFSGVAFPLGTFVVLTFWGIYAVDRELVFPKELDKVIPQWLNHVMHTTVLLFLLMEKYFCYHHYPSKTKGMSLTVFVGLIYQVWILWIAYYADIWVYPILEVLSWPGRVVFISVLWVALGFIYLLGEIFTNAVWAPAQVVRAKKVK